ncbi:uncharacterized protein [Zea mays]|uniref:uncharacterized protein isoform X1 n=1 Tax=Zea mays TaxID=4577 RepID=UPI0009A95DCA|nr:uncharacterized protein LOC100272970 isoform X1 [Zea mays]|eukprot:XP_020394427.1 uncharacterized protein LOC100272970 isoform X1 [Zea mays]
MGMWKVVCVTDASAYIASWIVRLLLDRGYTVRATVRDTEPTSVDLFKNFHYSKNNGFTEFVQKAIVFVRPPRVPLEAQYRHRSKIFRLP